MMVRVFLTLRDARGFLAVLQANHQYPVRVEANPGLRYAIHGPKGERLGVPIGIKREGDDLHVLVRHEGHTGESDFIIEDYFAVDKRGEGFVLTDLAGVPYVQAQQPLSVYDYNLQPGQAIDLHLRGEAPTSEAPDSVVAFGGTLGVGSVWADWAASATAVGVPAASPPPLAVASVRVFGDTDGDGQLNVEGSATPGALIRVSAPDGVTVYTTTADDAGAFVADFDLTNLLSNTGTYELTYVDVDGRQAPVWRFDLADLSLGFGGSSPPGVQVSFALTGAPASSGEVLWLGDLRLPLDAASGSGELQASGHTWAWQWDGARLTCTSSLALEADDLPNLVAGAHWESTQAADAGGTRVLQVRITESDGTSSDGEQLLRWGSPALAFDLNGDGAIAASVLRADFNGDGVLDAQAWVGPEDGVLVSDWSNALVGRGLSAADLSAWPEVSVLAGVRTFGDSNQDAVLDAQDPFFDVLGVWQDLDQDGVISAPELKRLSDWGIARVDLTPAVHQATLLNPQFDVLQQGAAHDASGQHVLLWQDLSLAAHWGLA